MTGESSHQEDEGVYNHQSDPEAVEVIVELFIKVGQSLKIVLCGTGGTGVTGVACCRQDGKGSIDNNPGVNGAEVHPNNDEVGPELVPELSELDICELQGKVGGGLSFLSCSKNITLCPVCDLTVCAAVGKPTSLTPKAFTLFIYNSEAVFAYVYNTLGKLTSCFHSNALQYCSTLCALHKLQPSSQMPVRASAQWRKR